MPRTALLVLVLALAPLGCGESAAPVPDWAKVSDAQKAAAKEVGVPVAFENSIGMRFVLIPAGRFTMGLPADEEGRDEDERQHDVVLTKPFYMGITEVTNAQFRRWRPDHDSGEYEDEGLNADDQPVVRVSWDDAMAFVGWVGAQDRAHTYRLPTEAEWEWACRAGTRTRFWWGDAEADGWKYANANDPRTKEAFGFDWEGWPKDDGHRVTAPVGSYPPNSWGLYDVSGNVWEWCQDWYGDYPTDRVTDPSGRRDGTSRVLRGGSWRGVPGDARSAHRGRSGPDYRGGNCGFRLAAPLPASR